MHLFRRGRGSFYRVRRAAGDEVPLDRLGERLVQDVVHLLDGRAREDRVEAVTIETLEMESVQVRELESPESGLDVVGDEVLIPRVGGLPNRSAHGVSKPTVQVVAYGRATRVKNDPAVPIRHSLRELRRHLCSRLAVQNLALRPFFRMDRVADLPATILAMADAALVVSALLRHELLLALHQFSGFHAQRVRELADGRSVGGPSPEFQLVDCVVSYTTPFSQRPQGERPLHPEFPQPLPIYSDAFAHTMIIH